MTHTRVADRTLTIDKLCAWPNLQKLADGTVGAFAFNQPSHGGVEGDIELWVSRERAAPWERRSVVSAHDAGTVRMNAAAGALRDGRLVVLVSGWNLRSASPVRTDRVLEDIQVCLSEDGGMTWTRHCGFERPDGSGRFMPFGNIREDEDGSLMVAAYDCRMTTPEQTSRRSSVYLFASHDDARSWTAQGPVGEDFFTETDILASKDGWVAVARTLSDYTHPDDPLSQPRVRLFHGSPDGHSWEKGMNLSLPGQHPGHLLRLANGGILFSCGSRIPDFLGVFGRTSMDEGKTWSEPFVLVDDGIVSDLGYPSTIQLDNGSILTAYYAKETRAHHGYHMGVVQWNFAEKG